MFDENLRAELIHDGSDTVRIPSTMEDPGPGQMVGTPHERLGEVSCRLCYESMGVDPITHKPKGRTSEKLHEHIKQVKNYSVYEHCTFTVIISLVDTPTLAQVFINRPGVWFHGAGGYQAEITINHRSVLEWDSWSETRVGKTPGAQEMTSLERVTKIIGDILYNYARPLAPSLYGDEREIPTFANIGIQEKKAALTQDQAWVSIYMSGSRGYCYDSETEVLTSQGWKKWPDVAGDEQFATLNLETNQLEYQGARALCREPYKGLMYQIATECVDLKVTFNHRMVVRGNNKRAEARGDKQFQIMEARDIFGKRVHFKRTAEWVGESPEFFEVEEFYVSASVRNQTGDCGSRLVTCEGAKIPAMWFAKFIGYWLAEGGLDHSDGSGYMTTLSQNIDGDAWGDIIETLTHLGYPFSYRANGDSENNKVIKISGGRALYEYLLPYSGVSNKGIPAELKGWAPEYQRTLIKAYLQGDGSFAARAAIGEGNTVSKRLADDLQEAALKAGWSASIRISDRRGEERTGKWSHIKNRQILYIVGFADKRNSEPLVNHNGRQDDSCVEYDGMIYCVTVPSGTLYVRRNGKPCWSGNSHEQVRHGDFSAISQRSSRFCDETESPYVVHPLVSYFLEDPNVDIFLKRDILHRTGHSMHTDQACYITLVNTLQEYLKKRGVEGTNARKQARGAARGYLGNALYTDMIFSANCRQWNWILSQRAAALADAEIRNIYAPHVLLALQESQYAHMFDGLELAPAPDGIGQIVVARS